jgi:hypothetical protein
LSWGLVWPKFFERGRFFEELLGHTKFKNFIWTGGISSNFPGVDFFGKVNGKNLAISVKTTTTPSADTWFAANTKHLDDLKEGFLKKIFEQGKTKVPVDLIQLHIFVPKGNQMSVSQLQNLVDGRIGAGKVKVIVDTIEKGIGI